MSAVLEVISPGSGMTVQDLGRAGWKRFGVPPGGAMDEESARQANRLVGNRDSEPVVELLFSGAKFRVMQKAEFAVTGADVDFNGLRSRSFFLEEGDEIIFSELRAGVWTYLAVQGGFDAPRWFGSASVNPRAGLGLPLQRNAILTRRDQVRVKAISARFLATPMDHTAGVAEFPVWPGPEWHAFPEKLRTRFFEKKWTVSARSDRTGYRLEGGVFESLRIPMLSAPLTVGVIQIPPDGCPIVIQRDGPTVGGYPRFAIMDPSVISRFAQCGPGTQVCFRLLE